MEKEIIKGECSAPVVAITLYVIAVIFFFVCAGIGAVGAGFGVGGFFALLGIMIHLYYKCEITVTDKRVYGTACGMKRVDLPIDSITSVSSDRASHRISVSTPSGFISFANIKNYNEIHDAITKLIINR